MVRFVRKLGMKPGKEREAQEWIIELANYTNKTLAPPTWQVFQPQFGSEDLFTIVMMADFPSLAEMERHLERIFADPGFQKINARGAEVGERPIITSTYHTIV